MIRAAAAAAKQRRQRQQSKSESLRDSVAVVSAAQAGHSLASVSARHVRLSVCLLKQQHQLQSPTRANTTVDSGAEAAARQYAYAE